MLFLAAHNARAAAATCVAAAVLAALAARIAFPVDLAVFHPPRDVPMIELLAVMFAAIAAGVTTPRLVEWEKLGVARVAVWSGAVVFAVAVLTLPVVFAGVAFLPPGAPWQYIPANAVVFAAVACLGRLLIGPVAGPVFTMLLFLGACVLQNTLPGLAAWLPLSRPNSAPLHPVVPAVATALAIAATGYGRGLTTWAHSRMRD